MWSPYRHITTEEHSFRSFLQEYDSFLFLFISKKIQKREDAKDVLQNVLVHLWQYRKSLLNGNIEAILVKACTQKIAEYYRENTKIQTGSLTPEMQPSDSCENELQLLIEKEEHLAAMHMALENLIPPIRREIFKMNKLQGVTQEQISKRLNIPKRTVEHHISQSLSFLKNKLDFLKKS